MQRLNMRYNKSKISASASTSSTSCSCSADANAAEVHDTPCGNDTKERRPWRRILYEEQDYPDNYCGPSFMDGLQTNVTAEHYSLSECVRGSGVVCNQLCVVYLFVMLYICCIQQLIPAFHIFLSSIIISLVLFLAAFRPVLEELLSDCQTLLLFFGYGYGLSPVVRTLTATVSTDTIYAMAAMVFLMHLAFHDYGVDAPLVSAHFSVNAAMFAVVCLVSRVDATEDAFVLICLAVQLFAFWPMLRQKLMCASPHGSLLLQLFTLLVGVSLVLLLVLCSCAVCACLVMSSFLFISFICPLGLVALQPLKNTIHGPWDEAMLPDMDSLLLS